MLRRNSGECKSSNPCESPKFNISEKMKNVAILVYPLLHIPSNQMMIASLQDQQTKSKGKDIQIDSVIQAHPYETTHLTNTEVTSSKI